VLRNDLANALGTSPKRFAVVSVDSEPRTAPNATVAPAPAPAPVLQPLSLSAGLSPAPAPVAVPTAVVSSVPSSTGGAVVCVDIVPEDSQVFSNAQMSASGRERLPLSLAERLRDVVANRDPTAPIRRGAITAHVDDVYGDGGLTIRKLTAAEREAYDASLPCSAPLKRLSGALCADCRVVVCCASPLIC
jgi:hypothetical protein